MKQSQALAIMKAGQSVFLTGQAGAGKTYVLNQYIQYLKKRLVPVSITASTGIAASHMNGMTIHGWSGIGIKDEMTDKDIKGLRTKKALIDRLQNTEVLIIDEVSMLHAKQLDMVDSVLRHFRQSDEPFGGIQVIFAGDFFQLPPVSKTAESTKERFAFMSKAWIELATSYDADGFGKLKICYLSEQHRQTDTQTDNTPTLTQILNEIRDQTVSQSSVQALLASRHNALSSPTHLYTHNAKVNEINELELKKLKGNPQTFIAQTDGDEALVTTLTKQVLAPEELSLKVGAKVMFIKNNAQEDYYNGTMGEIIKFVNATDEYGSEFSCPVVKTYDNRTIVVKPELWSIDSEEGEVLASFRQIPLCLAWAITVHKSQGMTLDCAEIDLSGTFEKGQGYVALSRVRSLKGLRLLGLNDKSLLLDEFAQVANRRFLALSKDAECWLAKLEQGGETDDPTDTPLFALQSDFLRKKSQSERTVSPLEPKSAPNSTPQPKLPNQNLTTPAKLSNLLAQQASLDQLAKELCSAKAVVIDQIRHALHTGDLTASDIDHLAPDSKLIDKVKSVQQALLDAGETRIKVGQIFDELREQVSRTDIQLALMFLDLPELTQD